MTILQRGSRGEAVGIWQAFLQKRGWLLGPVDGIFGDETFKATSRFQASRRLSPDGIVGPATLQTATALGLTDSHPISPSAPSTPLPTNNTQANDYFPAKPHFSPLMGNTARQRLFGSFSYRPAPNTTNPEALEITDGWDRENLVLVEVPGLAGIPLGSSTRLSKGKMLFHRKGANQVVALWQAWCSYGLLKYIRTFDGSYVARFQRGSHTALSNHAFGSAFDINAHWNRIKHQPARIGSEGCLLELVTIANEHGFYWGGHFSSRPDGMHFEIAKLI